MPLSAAVAVKLDGDPLIFSMSASLLEDVAERWLPNAQHLMKPPGRMSDVNALEPIAEIVAHDLVRSSFVPPASDTCASWPETVPR